MCPTNRHRRKKVACLPQITLLPLVNSRVNVCCMLTLDRTVNQRCIYVNKREKIKWSNRKLLALRNNICRCLLSSWSQLFIHYQNRHHNHHVVPQARISLTLSLHFSRSFIISGESPGLHPISSHSCWMYVRAGRPAFARPYVGVHRSTSLMSSSLFLQQWPACLVRLVWIVFVMGGRWPYSWCFVGCCLQDLFNIARNILE